MSWQDEIPGYREALAKERMAREASFIDAADRVAGFHISPLTLRRYLSLRAMGQPLLCGGVPSPLELVQFLTFMHPGFSPGCRPPRGAHRLIPPVELPGFGLLARIRRRAYARAVYAYSIATVAVQGWIEKQWADAGPGGGNVNEKEYWSGGCGLIFQLARETGWSENDILDIPLPRLFQYRKIISKINNPSVPLFNPSDRVPMQWIKSQRPQRN